MKSLPCTAAAGALAIFAALLAPTGTVHADPEDWTAPPTYSASPEHFGLELRLGVYHPEGLGPAFSSPEYFGGDFGPMLSFELHYFPWRIPYIGLVGAGGGLGWSQWDTPSPGSTPTGGETQETDRNVFEIITVRPFLLLRFDTLARELNFPIVITPKIGLDVAHWLTSAGGSSEADGWSIGPRFAGKVSLELDFLEPRAARQLDEEWGINHSEIFFELYYSMAGELVGGQLPMSGWGWAAGLGFTF